MSRIRFTSDGNPQTNKTRLVAVGDDGQEVALDVASVKFEIEVAQQGKLVLEAPLGGGAPGCSDEVVIDVATGTAAVRTAVERLSTRAPNAIADLRSALDSLPESMYLEDVALAGKLQAVINAARVVTEPAAVG